MRGRQAIISPADLYSFPDNNPQTALDTYFSSSLSRNQFAISKAFPRLSITGTPTAVTQQKLPVYDPSYTDSSLPASDIHPGFRYSFAMYGAIAASMADSFS